MPEDLSVWDIVKLTGAPTEAIGRCLIRRERGTVKISEPLSPKNCRNLTSCAEDSPASLSQMLENAEDLLIQGGRCSLNCPVWLKPESLGICCLKMFPDCFTMTKGGHLRQSSMRWTDWGILWNGRCLTARISTSPNPAKGCILSDILMCDAEEKYFLSPKQQEHLLYKSSLESKGNGSIPRKESAAP